MATIGCPASAVARSHHRPRVPPPAAKPPGPGAQMRSWRSELLVLPRGQRVGAGLDLLE
jgi:hypothetical protein